MTNDDDLPRPRPHHSFSAPPQLVCLDCGKAIFGPIVKPFNLIEGEECEICAQPTCLVHGSVFRDYEEMFSRR